MKLHIQFFDGKDEDAKRLANKELLVPSFLEGRKTRDEGDKVCGEIQWGKEDTVFIEARLEDFPTGEDVKGKYQLKLACRPDYEPCTDKDGFFFVEVKGKTCFRIQLLRGADGQSFLHLIHRVSTADGALETDAAVWSIYVKPRREKREALRLMVDEMLPVNPFGVLSEFDGLSRTNVLRKWECVSTAAPSCFWHIETRIEECERQMNLMRPYFLALASRHASILMRNLERCSVPKEGRRVYAVTHRDIKRRSAFMNGAKVYGLTLRQSYDIPIHGAIVDFLVTFGHVLRSVLKELEMSSVADLSELESIPLEDKYKRDDVYDEIRYKGILQGRAQSVLDDCCSFLTARYPWIGCRRRSVTTISIKDVPNAESYKALFFLMLRYCQKRNFRGAIEGNFYVPRFIRNQEDETPSLWQRNYSFVYEVWVFKRLVEAFIDEGFYELRSKYMQQIAQSIMNIKLGTVENVPLCASRGDGLEVSLYHGILAYKEGTSNNGTAIFSTGTRKRLTPDFAIIFSNPQDRNDKYGIVLDAKSGNVLDWNSVVNSRDKYKGKFKIYGQPPHQSWLVYSGLWNGKAGIECNAKDAKDDYGVAWQEELWQEDPLCDNGDMCFSAEHGIDEYGRNCRSCVVGHLRANINSVRGNGDVFRDFVHGQIATVKSWFGL